MAKVKVIDNNLKRGASTLRILKANGYESRCMGFSGPKSKELDLEWPDMIIMADHPEPKSFKVVYRGSCPRPSNDDTYFFLELSRYLIRQISYEFPFPLT